MLSTACESCVTTFQSFVRQCIVNRFVLRECGSCVPFPFKGRFVKCRSCGCNHLFDRHSPQDVLRGVLARTLPAPTLARISFATEFTRHLDRSGYIRFRRWRFYAEAGLAKQEVSVHIYTSMLKIEYQDTELAFYTIEPGQQAI